MVFIGQILYKGDYGYSVRDIYLDYSYYSGLDLENHFYSGKHYLSGNIFKTKFVECDDDICLSCYQNDGIVKSSPIIQYWNNVSSDNLSDVFNRIVACYKAGNYTLFSDSGMFSFYDSNYTSMEYYYNGAFTSRCIVDENIEFLGQAWGSSQLVEINGIVHRCSWSWSNSSIYDCCLRNTLPVDDPFYFPLENLELSLININSKI